MLAAAAAAACLTFAAAPALADMSERNLSILARSLSFVRNFDKDSVRVGVVWDAASPRSSDEAKLIESAIGEGLMIADLRLTVVQIEVSRLADSEADVLLVTSGLQSRQAEIAEIAARKKILSISSDMTCVEDGYCVLGVQSEPSVQVVMSSSAASRNGVAFQPAFRMMVTER